MSKKYLLIALIVVAQIGLAYFLITYFIIPALLAEKDPNEASVETEETEEDEETEEGSGEIYVVEDVIVNPAGTLGTRYLAVTVGLEVGRVGTIELLKKRDMELKDTLIDIFSSRTLDKLEGTRNREELREEVLTKVNQKITKGDLKKVHFANL